MQKLQEQFTFSEYKKEVISKISSLFKKFETESHADTGLLGRDKPRTKLVSAQILRMLQDLATKHYNNLNIILRLNPSNTIRVVYKKVDDAFYTYIYFPNYYMNVNMMDDVKERVLERATNTDLEQYDGSTRIKTTPQINYQQQEDPNLDEKLEELTEKKHRTVKKYVKRFMENTGHDEVDAIASTTTDPNEFVQKAKAAGLDEFDIGHALQSHYSIEDHHEVQRILQLHKHY